MSARGGRGPLTALGAALLAVGMAAAVPGAPPEAVRRPQVSAGPYSVVVDRITQNRSLLLEYGTNPGRREQPAIQSRRSVQLQLALYSLEKWAAAGLATFQVGSVRIAGSRGVISLPHYGGQLETPGDGAIVRAYLYVPSVPSLAGEIRWLEGEIVSYENTAPLEIEIPLVGAAAPRSVTVAGVKATLRELSVDGPAVRLSLFLEAPAGSVLANTAADNSFGVTVLAANQRPASSGGGTFLQPRPNQADYRLAFNSTQSPPARLRVRVLHRAGPRRVFPFRLEHIPLPNHAAPPHDQGKKE